MQSYLDSAFGAASTILAVFLVFARLAMGRLSFTVLRFFDWREFRIIIGMHPDPSTDPLPVLLRLASRALIISCSLSHSWPPENLGSTMFLCARRQGLSVGE